MLLWERRTDPYCGRLVAPRRLPRRRARRSSSRSAATSRPRWTCGSSRTSSNSGRSSDPARHPDDGSSQRPTSASCRATSTPRCPADTRWHPVDALPRDGVRPRRDRPRRPRAAARKALVYEPRLRARAGDVHDLRAARALRRRARARRVGDEPAARARCGAAPARARPATRREPGRPAAARRRCSASGRASSRSPTSSRFCAHRSAPAVDAAAASPYPQMRFPRRKEACQMTETAFTASVRARS